MSRIVEYATTGFDEYLQGLSGDPYGGSSSFGLRVPTLATPDKSRRYLFLLSTFSLSEGQRARILGYRQFSSIGVALNPTRFIEQEIISPNFRLPDGNISFHLQALGGPNAQGFPNYAATPLDLNSFKKGWATTPCLLYKSYSIPAGNRLYPQLTSYTPPNLGKPWGSPLPAGCQGTFYDQRTEWRTHGAWRSLDMEIEGPLTVGFFASVYQSAGTYVTADATPPGLGVEEQFMSKFAGEVGEPIYWRVAGSLVVELTNGRNWPDMERLPPQESLPHVALPSLK
jgi:hypothetical protein